MKNLKEQGVVKLVVGIIGVALVVISLALAFLSSKSHADGETVATPTEHVATDAPVQEEESYLLKKYHELKAWYDSRTTTEAPAPTAEVAQPTAAAPIAAPTSEAVKADEEQKKSTPKK
jgi:hypothetical protein